MIVVFPAPVGPTKATSSPGCDREAHVLGAQDGSILSGNGTTTPSNSTRPSIGGKSSAPGRSFTCGSVSRSWKTRSAAELAVEDLVEEGAELEDRPEEHAEVKDERRQHADLDLAAGHQASRRKG